MHKSSTKVSVVDNNALVLVEIERPKSDPESFDGSDPPRSIATGSSPKAEMIFMVWFWVSGYFVPSLNEMKRTQLLRKEFRDAVLLCVSNRGNSDRNVFIGHACG
jgi:hypothetical protein